MVRATNEKLGVNPRPRWSWVPLASFIIVAATSVGGLLIAIGAYKGRVEVIQATSSKEAGQLLAAAAELRAATTQMENRLNGRLESIQATVNASAGEVRTLTVRVDEREKRYAEIHDAVEMQRIQMQTLREKLAANGFKLPP